MDSSGIPEESKHCQWFLLLQHHTPWYHSHISPLSCCSGLQAELCLLWHPCHSDDAAKPHCTGVQGQVLGHRTSWRGRKAGRVCSLKDWTAAAFYNPLSLLIRFIIFMLSLVFYRGYGGILCYSVPALLPTHNISPAYIEQSSALH